MRSEKLYIALALSAFLVVACKKQALPTEESGTPEFYFKGEVDGVNLNVEAGNNNYYMDASHYQDTTGVYVFQGKLNKDNCDSTCDYSIAILINDSKVTKAQETMNANAALKTGMYLFNDENLAPLYYKVSLLPIAAYQTTDSYQWQIINHKGETFEADTFHSEFFLNADETYRITLNHKNNMDCDTAHTNIFTANSAFQTTVVAKRNDVGFKYTYDFQVLSNQTDIKSFEWNFGDNSPVSSQASPSHSFQAKAFGFYIVRLKLTNSKGDSCISFYQINANPDKNCHANFTANFVKVPNTWGYSSVTVMVTKPGGEVFSSKNTSQPNSSLFEVISVEDYKANKKGEATKRLKIKLNCVLKSKTNSIEIKNAEAVFAMSYK